MLARGRLDFRELFRKSNIVFLVASTSKLTTQEVIMPLNDGEIKEENEA